MGISRHIFVDSNGFNKSGRRRRWRNEVFPAAFRGSKEKQVRSETDHETWDANLKPWRSIQSWRNYIIEGSLEVKLPTIWTDEKQSREEAEKRERLEERRVRRKKMQMREKVGKSRNTVFFQWFGAPEGRKVGSLKRRVRSQLARWEMKNCTPLWREAHFQVKMYKTPHSRTTFGSWDVQKVHAVVARSTFRSENVQNTPFSDHFWKLRCPKSARRCGAKHISKWTCTKHPILGPLLEVEMSKKCTPLWREAHFEVNMYKTHHSRTTFDSWNVQKVHAVVARSAFPSQNVQSTPAPDHFWQWRCRKVHAVVARSTFPSQNVRNTSSSDHFWKFRSRRCGAKHIFEVKMFKAQGVRTTFGGSDVASLHYTTLHYTTLHSTTLHYRTLHYTTRQYTTLQYTKLHYTTLHYTTLRSTTLHYTTSHYTTLHSTTLHYTILHYLPLHFTALHYTTLHYTTTTTTQLHSTTLNYTTLHDITLHYTTFRHTPLHHTTLHYTTLHWMTLHHR